MILDTILAVEEVGCTTIATKTGLLQTIGINGINSVLLVAGGGGGAASPGWYSSRIRRRKWAVKLVNQVENLRVHMEAFNGQVLPLGGGTSISGGMGGSLSFKSSYRAADFGARKIAVGCRRRTDCMEEVLEHMDTQMSIHLGIGYQGQSRIIWKGCKSVCGITTTSSCSVGVVGGGGGGSSYISTSYESMNSHFTTGTREGDGAVRIEQND